jgi:hypothetical protein
MALLAIAQELDMAEVLWTYDWMTMRQRRSRRCRTRPRRPRMMISILS